MKYSIIALFLFLSTALPAQNFSISGTLTDKKEGTPLEFVSVALRSSSDSTFRKGALTDIDGHFIFNNIGPGQYSLQVSYMGYQDFKTNVLVSDADVTGISIQLEADPQVLSQVDVVTLQQRAIQKGDTTEYNAAAYKVNKDATVEDLVNKMPGITMENGVLKAGGEEVKKVTIDGRDFFGDDAAMALKNLPAEIVDKVQVFDRQTDQAAFTGFSDGTTDKTLNIKTKSGKANGTFGKIYAGYGTDEHFKDSRYALGGNINMFNGARRFSILGMSNNINMQNFSSQDLLGVSQSSSGGKGSGGRGGGSYGGRGGNDASGNFMVGQNNGINTTNSFGINYNDEWGKKWKVSGSYFFNSTQNNSGSITERTYFLSGNNNQQYHEENSSRSNNMNHRVNMRLEWTIDTMNSLIITPRLSLQQNNSRSSLLSYTISSENALLNNAVINNRSESMGYSLSNGILYRHKFKKRGRTVSLNLQTDYNDRSGENSLYSETSYYDSLTTKYTLDQLANTASGGYSLSPNISYTEPLGKKSQLMFTYSPTYTNNFSEKVTNGLDAGTGNYTSLDSALTNNFDNTVMTQRGGMSYRLSGEKFSFNLSADYQQLELSSAQTFPLQYDVKHKFQNVLPRMFYRYKFSKRTNVRLSYNGSTRTPSINQLQNVINNNNPLQLSSGNPNLKQQYDNNVTARFTTVDSTGTRPLFLLFSYTYTNLYIGNSTVVAQSDTIINNQFVLSRGGQYSQPVNLNGYMNIRSFLTYGLPVIFIKSNLNLNAGFTYNRAPSLINNIKNTASTYNVNAGMILGSNISENIDFKLAYSANYNIVKNTITPQRDNNYYTGVASARVNFILKEKWILGSDVNLNHYAGLGQGFNQSIVLWNGAFGYKFLKNNAGELRLSVYDILKKNRSISRNVTETYVEDVQTNVLQRFFMLTFTYNLRAFKTQATKPEGESGGSRGSKD